MLEQIKAKVSIRDLFDVLGVRVKGRQAFCPLHEDKRPSLGFKDSGLWYCFVCGVGGDIVNLVMETQKLNFRESLLWINEKFSLGLTDKKAKRNFYLEALNKNYYALKNSLHDEFNANCERYYNLMSMVRTQNYPYLFWTAKDFTFELMYHEIQDGIESKLRELENARYKLRRTATQSVNS